MVVPGAFKALVALSASAEAVGVSKRLLNLVHLRASQINGCSVWVDLHARDLRKAGETDERLFALRPGARRRTSPTPSARHSR